MQPSAIPPSPCQQRTNPPSPLPAPATCAHDGRQAARDVWVFDATNLAARRRRAARIVTLFGDTPRGLAYT
jgi:hypothetical protein